MSMDKTVFIQIKACLFKETSAGKGNPLQYFVIKIKLILGID